MSGLLLSSCVAGGRDTASLNLVSSSVLAKDLGIKLCSSFKREVGMLHH